jgi:hypothetical protein
MGALKKWMLLWIDCVAVMAAGISGFLFLLSPMFLLMVFDVRNGFVIFLVITSVFWWMLPWTFVWAVWFGSKDGKKLRNRLTERFDVT